METPRAQVEIASAAYAASSDIDSWNDIVALVKARLEAES